MGAIDCMESGDRTAALEKAVMFDISIDESEFVVALFSDGSAIVTQPETGYEQPVFNFKVWAETGQVC